MRELTDNEVTQVSGGTDWGTVAAGVGMVAAGVAIVATAGLATVPIALAGAATSGELLVAGAGMASSLAGGVAIGDGATSD